MLSTSVRKHLPAIASAFALTLATAAAQGATYSYVNWTADTLSTSLANGSATGTISGPNVTVTYTGDVSSATQILSGGVDYYTPSGTYTNSTVSNLPTNNNIITLSEAPAHTNTLLFSSAVTNPIIDLVSLGGGGTTVSYNFSATPTILSQGVGYWAGGCATCLTVSGNSVSGNEGDGVIQFAGTYTTLSWTTTGAEVWNGFTVGVASNTPEPATWTGLLMASLLAFPALRKKLQTNA